MKVYKYIFNHFPKSFRWLLLVIIISPLLIQLVLKFAMNQTLSFNINNILILGKIAICTFILGIVFASFRSVKKLLHQTNQSDEVNKNLIELPYSKITIGEFKSKHLCVDINARIILNENMKPDLSTFLDRVYIDQPYCPNCSKPLDSWYADLTLETIQIGFKCISCSTQREGDYDAVLGNAKGQIRKNYDKYWTIYIDKILKLTKNEPQKYKLP